jgi:hypothetical protein
MSSFVQLIPRRFNRKVVKMALLMFVEREGEREKYDSLTLDISINGARVRADASLAPGQVVEVVSVEGNEPVVRARVVWVGKPASEVEGQAGLEFLDPFDIAT